MTKATNYFLIILLVLTAFATTSCSESDLLGDEDRKEEQQVPASKAEAEEKIEGKWNLSGSGDVQSVEFLADGTYILEVSAGSQLTPSSSKVGGRGLVTRSAAQRANSTAPDGASGTVLTGTYTVSSDGKTITLDQIATITITSLTEANFSFSITFKEGNKTVEVALQPAPTVASSDRTNLLARTWGYREWPSDLFLDEEVVELTKLGLKLEDLKFTFTKSGTLVMVDAAVWSTSSPQPEPDPLNPDPAPPIPDQYGYELESWVIGWDWVDSQQNAIKLTVAYSDGHEYSADVRISEMTATSLKFSEWIGDSESLDLVPLSR